MVEALRVVLGVLVVASLATIVAYVLMFVAVMVSTVLGAHRRDPLADELDEVLADILGPRTPAGAWLRPAMPDRLVEAGERLRART